MRGALVVNGLTFNHGAVLTAVLNFFLVAAVRYFLVMTPLNRLSERFKRKEKPGNEGKLPAESRDEMRLSRQGT